MLILDELESRGIDFYSKNPTNIEVELVDDYSAKIVHDTVDKRVKVSLFAFGEKRKVLFDTNIQLEREEMKKLASVIVTEIEYWT